MNSVYLIDNSNFCYRFKSVYKYSKIEVSGVSVDTSILVGYIRSLKLNFMDNIIIVLDGVPEQSLCILPSYKGQRSKDPMETVAVPKLEFIKFLTKVGERLNKNIQVVCSPGQEADQVISSLVHLITGNQPSKWKLISDFNTHPLSSDRILSYLHDSTEFTTPCDVSTFDSVIIGTTDSDMRALQSYDNVLIDLSISGKNLSHSATAKAVSNVNVFAIPIYKAIFGDVSDNVPGYKLSKKWISYINNHINSLADKSSFVKKIEESDISDPLVREIMSYDEGALFKRNYQIVNLEFYSVPIVLQYPDYDIDSTIRKFKLKI